jgi:hypothetical protein
LLLARVTQIREGDAQRLSERRPDIWRRMAGLPHARSVAPFKSQASAAERACGDRNIILAIFHQEHVTDSAMITLINKNERAGKIPRSRLLA